MGGTSPHSYAAGKAISSASQVLTDISRDSHLPMYTNMRQWLMKARVKANFD